MNDNIEEIRNGLAQILTVQYDYPPNGEGFIGYKGNNLYRFKVSDEEKIMGAIQKRAESYKHSYNYQVLYSLSMILSRTSLVTSSDNPNLSSSRGSINPLWYTCAMALAQDLHS